MERIARKVRREAKVNERKGIKGKKGRRKKEKERR